MLLCELLLTRFYLRTQVRTGILERAGYSYQWLRTLCVFLHSFLPCPSEAIPPHFLMNLLQDRGAFRFELGKDDLFCSQLTFSSLW